MSRFRPTVVAFLFFVPLVVELFIFRNFFLGGFPANVDTLTQFYPYFQFLAQGKGQLTQLLLSGFPLLASPMSVLSPLTSLALLIFSPLAAYKAIILVNIGLTYFFTYLFARKLHFEPLVAIFIGTVFTFSGQILLWAGTLPNTTYFILPGVLWLIEVARAHDGWRKRLTYIAAGSLLGVGWLSGHPQFILYIHVFVALYILWQQEWRKNFLALAYTNLVSGLLGLGRIYATLDFQPLTPRAHGVGLSDFFIHAYWPHDVFHYLLPFFYIPTASTYASNLYVGILPLFLLVCAIFLFSKIKDRRFRFFGGVFIFCLLASIKYSPLAYLMHYLPLFNAFRDGSRIMLVGNFALALMAGYSLQYLVTQRSELGEHADQLARRLKVIGLLILSGAFITTCIYFLFSSTLTARLLSVATAVGHRVIAAAEVSRFLQQFTLRDWQLDVFIVMLFGLTFLARRYATFTSRQFLTATILLTCINFSAAYAERINGDYATTIDQSAVAALPSTIAFIKKQNPPGSAPFRIFTNSLLGALQEAHERCGRLSDQETYLVAAAVGTPNINMQYGLDHIQGYDNYQPSSISEINSYINHHDISQVKGLLQMMNVRYVLSAEPIRDPDFVPVFSDTIGSCKILVTVYELSEYWPRYYIDDVDHPIVPIQIGGTLLFSVPSNPATSTLYIGNTYLPRWEATSNGTVLPIQPANHVYMSVAIPARTHVIELSYRQPFSL